MKNEVRNKIKLVNSLALLVLFAGIIFSGLVLQKTYHMEHAEVWQTAIGLNYYDWSAFHRVSSLIGLLAVILHIAMRLELYKAVFTKKSFKKRRSVMLITLIFAIASLTGIAAYIIDILSSVQNSGIWHYRKGLIEIHDKITFALIVLIILHVKIHFQWIIKQIKKIIPGKVSLS